HRPRTAGRRRPRGGRAARRRAGRQPLAAAAARGGDRRRPGRHPGGRRPARDRPARPACQAAPGTGHLRPRRRRPPARRRQRPQRPVRAAAPADRLPWLVLLADGWEGLVTAYHAVDHGRPVETLLRLVREGAAVGIRVVLTGDRAVLSGRAGSAFRDRLVLRFADPADYGLAGISPRVVPAAMPPGRALVGADVREAQLAVLDPETSGA